MFDAAAKFTVAIQSPISGFLNISSQAFGISCKLDGGIDLSTAVAVALFSDPSLPSTLDMQRMICQCSCASEIRNIYGGLLRQWSLLNDAVNSGILVLNAMCKSDHLRLVSASVNESTSVQCASNNISVTLTVTSPNSFVPAGSVITLVGLNAEVPPNGVQVRLSPPSLLQSFVWNRALCSQYCIPNRQCAVASSCNNSAISRRPGLCSQWCETDAALQITVNGSFQATTILITVNNPCSESRIPPSVSVAISGPNFFAPFSAVKQPSIPVLMFSTAPVFSNFQVSEDQRDELDLQQQIWRGSALGQRNTLNFSFLSNVDLYSGANITMSGLKYSLAQNLTSPSVRQAPSLFSDLVIDSWLPDSGTIVIRISSKLEGPAVLAQHPFSFGLELTMPLTSAMALKTSPTIFVGASGLGPLRSCCCSVATFVYTTQVLVPKSTNLPFFPILKIGQSTCFPGECNIISVTIAVNTAISGSINSFDLTITGLNGMDLNSSCGSTCSTSNSIVELQDVTPGAYISVNI
jgi:hypothetical protein